MTRPFLRLIIVLTAWKTADRIKDLLPRHQQPQKLLDLISQLTMPLHRAGQQHQFADAAIRDTREYTILEKKLGPDALQHELVDAIKEIFPEFEDELEEIKER
jgi:hypothetical protein